MQTTISNFSFLSLGLPLLATGVWLGTIPAGQAAEPGRWRFDASINAFAAGLRGDVTARGLPAEIDASFSDIAEHFEMCGAGRVTLSYDRWSLSTEVSYLGLGASTRFANIDLDQWLVEPTIGYQFSDLIEAFAGVRYNNISGEVHFDGPLGKVTSGTQDWYDPIIGAQVSLPLLGKKLTMDGRFDVGGFGVGSDLTWQAYPYLNWHFAKWASVQLGYRWLGTDYENGNGSNKFVYDVVVQGPQVGFTLHF